MMEVRPQRLLVTAAVMVSVRLGLHSPFKAQSLPQRAIAQPMLAVFVPTVYVNDPNSPDNAIMLNTYLRVEGDTYFVRSNQSIVLTWNGAPRTDQRVDFKFSPADRTKQPYLLGSDTNLADGLATIIVTFAPNDLGIISAESYRPNGQGGETRSTFAKAF